MIDEIKAALARATPEPWRPFDNGPWGGQGAGVAIGDDVENWVVFGKHTQEPHISNSFLCANAPAWLAALVERVEKAEAEAEKYKHGWDELQAMRAELAEAVSVISEANDYLTRTDGVKNHISSTSLLHEKFRRYLVKRGGSDG